MFGCTPPRAIASPAPSLREAMTWYRWHPSTRQLQGRGLTAGSQAVLGLAAPRDLRLLRARYGFTVVRPLPALHAVEIRTTNALLAGARRDGRIRYLSGLGPAQRLLAIAPVAPLVDSIDAVTGLPYEWQYAAADLGPALEQTRGSATIVVGTIDSGAAAIADLTGKVDSRWTVSPRGAVTRDLRGNDPLGHGSAVASLIAANGYGMAGFGGAAHVIAMRAPVLTGVAVAVALLKLDSLGVRIVNMSFGGRAAEPPIVLDAIHKAERDGLLLVAAAGNSTTAVSHPAADLQPPAGQASYGLAVGASDGDGKLAFFSNSGDNLSLLAPGNLQGTCSGVLVAAPLNPDFVDACYPSWTGANGASYAYVAGTSFAAPEVAGTAALVWSARPDLGNCEVADIIKRSARRSAAGWTPTMGYGILDAGAAVALTIAAPPRHAC